MTTSSAQTISWTTSDGDIISSSLSGVFVNGVMQHPGDYTITCDDTFTLDINNISSSNTIVLNGGSGHTIGGAGSTYSYTSGSGLGSITIDDISNWVTPTPFEDGFPEWHDFQEMCKEYPGLDQAYEKLKTFYGLCKDEWDFKKKNKD